MGRTAQSRTLDVTRNGYGAWHGAFLATLARTGNVSWALEQAGISRSAAYDYRSKHPEFAEKWEDAKQEGDNYVADLLEAEADRAALEGYMRPIYQGGKLVGHERVKSERLLMYRLSKLRPEYRNRTDVNVTITESEVDRRLREAWAELEGTAAGSAIAAVVGETEGGGKDRGEGQISEVGS